MSGEIIRNILDIPTLSINDAILSEIRAFYDSFATTYDETRVPKTTYPCLKCAVETFLEVAGDVNKNIRIIDIGAGTGNVGLELKKHGFTNVDGLDLSSKMLRRAKEKKAYKNYICEAVKEKRLGIETGTYDAVLSVAAVTNGYIKASAFDEILRLVKPGGHIVFTIRDVDRYAYAAKFKQLTDEGKWMEIKTCLTDYTIIDSGIVRTCFTMSYQVIKNE